MGPVALCVESDDELGVATGPVGAWGSGRLLVGDQERTEPFPQIVRVPQRPLGVGAVRFDVGLMVCFTDLVKGTSPETQRPTPGVGSAVICSLVGFSLARCLPGYYSQFHIFIRHHKILCSARSLTEANSTPRGSLGRRSIQDTACQLPETPLLSTPVNKGK